MLLLIDNYDSFTYNLSDYFLQLGETLIIKKNDEIDAQSIRDMHFDKVLISPGPNTPAESGNLMALLPEIVGKYPVLGVCLGHQALGQYFGADLVLAARPMHGKVSAIEHNGEGIYTGIPSPFNVCRYHSLIINPEKALDLRVTATTKEGECMSFVHRYMPVTGMQFHPEAILTEHGIDLLANWLKSI